MDRRKFLGSLLGFVAAVPVLSKIALSADKIDKIIQQDIDNVIKPDNITVPLPEDLHESLPEDLHEGLRVDDIRLYLNESNYKCINDEFYELIRRNHLCYEPYRKITLNDLSDDDDLLYKNYVKSFHVCSTITNDFKVTYPIIIFGVFENLITKTKCLIFKEIKKYPIDKRF